MEVASKRLLYQQVKIPVLVACHRWKCVLVAISGGVDISKVPECHWKDSITHVHGIAVYVKEELSFPQDFSLENYVGSYFCFGLPLLHSVPCFFYLY